MYLSQFNFVVVTTFIAQYTFVKFCVVYAGSRPGDHCFRTVCLFVQFFSAVFDPILIKLGNMLYVWV